MGAKAAVRLLRRRELASAPEHDRARLEARLAEEHSRTAGGIARALDIGVVDEVMEPDRTRSRVAEAMARLGDGRGLHGNIPL